MKSDADTIRSFLFELLELFGQTASSPSGTVDDSQGPVSSVENSSEADNADRWVPDGSPNVSAGEILSTRNTDITTDLPPMSKLGDLPAVQDHFQAVLKRRLQTQITQKPPLFPWESGLEEYPAELTNTTTLPWLAQLRSLELPTALPEDILAGLLNRCQAIMAEVQQPGIQLVKAVETLFPDQPQAMNQIAGLVLANAAVRSTATQAETETLKAAFPEGYAGANPQQQVTLTMLAAKDILDALTLAVTPADPVVERTWQTTEGAIALTATYRPGTPDQIHLAVTVPRASQLSLPSIGQTVTQNRPGPLNLTIPAPQLNEVYPLEVLFSEVAVAPLVFAVQFRNAG